MVINSKEELDILLYRTRAVSVSDVSIGGNFYKVKSQEFMFPDGSVQVREFLDKRRASVVVPMTDEGNLVFVVQPISLTKEGSLLEFPAGYFEIGEDGVGAGMRELAEETGYYSDDVIHLGYHYQDPGSIKQAVDVYLMTGCKNLGLKKLDRGEFCKEVEIPYNFALELMDEGYFMDANSYIALSKTEKYLKKHKLIEKTGVVYEKK